jgi:predicted metal-dependent HD superfamily phosphohydrolase
MRMGYIPYSDTVWAIVRDNLLERYAEPWRRYHTWNHIEANFVLIGDYVEASGFVHDVGDHVLLELGNVYHDAIWRADRSDVLNVQESADLARQHFGDRVANLVLYTNHSGEFPMENDELGWALHDVDLASLGTPADVFLANERKIVEEYTPWFPNPRFAAARRDFCEKYLNMPVIYRTDYFGNRCDAQARLNLQDAYERWKEVAGEVPQL